MKQLFTILALLSFSAIANAQTETQKTAVARPAAVTPRVIPQQQAVMIRTDV